MARLRNTATGVIVEVADEKADRLDGYELIKAESKRVSKSDDK